MGVECNYLIVGGGITADAAARGIREIDPQGTITMLSAESHAPYDRPPLSKKLWTGKPLDSIWRDTAALGVDLRLQTRAVSGDLKSRTITDDKGTSYTYKKLLLATGGAPRRLASADESSIYFRTFDDYEHVRSLADRKARFTVVGGGFIGSEIAAALTMFGCEVGMIFPESGIGARVYPAELSAFITDYFKDKGVAVRPGETFSAMQRSEEGVSVTTRSGASLQADAVIVGIGITPEIELAQALGLEVDNGILVDEFLRAGSADIYAAGDVANFHDSALGIRRRVEHEDNANTMGGLAGRNMAGQKEPYSYTPYFYSDLFDLGYEAVGELGSGMDIVEDWRKPFEKGVVYYRRNDQVKGVLLWNTWGQLEAARELIASREKLSPRALKGRISD